MSEPQKPTDINDTAAEQTADAPPAGATQEFKPAAAAPAAPSTANVQVPGYKMLGVLGRGGMGVVYKAIQEKANRLVALKMILAGAHADQSDRTRFHVEAAAAARMSHPNIVQLYEVGETPDGFPFFSLEFVAGGTLAERLKQGPLRPRDAAALVEALARAMQYAHERGIVHRDLKPLNILLEGGGSAAQAAAGIMQADSIKATLKAAKQDATPRTSVQSSSSSASGNQSVAVPKISDFGLAKQLDSEDGLTRTGAIMGSPAYMAPEQAFGQSKHVGPAADIYALGAILYECLTGRPPFKGATIADTLEQVRTMEPVTLKAFTKEIPADLETICLHCLHKEPQRRYASADALADDLRRYCEGKPITVRPVGNLERAWRWCRRNPGWAAMIALVAVSLIGVTGVSVGAYFEVSAQRDFADGERKKAEKARDDAKEAREKEKEKTLLAEARGEQSLKAVGLFATDARVYCEDAMVPGESRGRLYGVLIKQLEQQADQAAGEATIDALRNKVFLYQTLCAVNLDFNEHTKSKEWFDKGIEVVEQWEKLRPGDPPALSFRATLLNLRAKSLQIHKKLDESRRLDAEALAIRRKVVGAPDVDLPAKVETISALADSLDSLAQFDESIVLREKVCKMFAQDEAKYEEGTKGYKEARERSFPYREALSWTCMKAGLDAGDYEVRKKLLLKADALSKDLMSERSTSRNILLRWALISKMLGELEFSYGKLAEKEGKIEAAEKYFADALIHYRKLNAHSRDLATSTQLVDGVRDYSRSFYTLGRVEKSLGNFTRARDLFQTSREIREQALRDYGTSPMSLHLRLDVFFSQVALGEIREPMEQVSHMIFTLRTEPDAEYRLACLYALIIDSVEETRKPDPLTAADKKVLNICRSEALRCLQYAHDGGFTDFFQSNIDADFGSIRADPRMKEFEATHFYQLGILEKKRGDAKKARAHFEKSQDLAEQGMKFLRGDDRYANVKLAWLCAHVQLGHQAEAIEEADLIQRKLAKKTPAMFNLARVYALACAAAADPKLQEQYRTQALTALQDAGTVATEARLVADEDLDAIRSDPRFKKLLDLAKKQPR